MSEPIRIMKNPFDNDQFFETEILAYQQEILTSQKTSLNFFKKTYLNQRPFFMSLQENYLKTIHFITKNALVATILMLLALTTVTAAAAELAAPKEYKPSTILNLKSETKQVVQPVAISSSSSSSQMSSSSVSSQVSSNSSATPISNELLTYTNSDIGNNFSFQYPNTYTKNTETISTLNRNNLSNPGSDRYKITLQKGSISVEIETVGVLTNGGSPAGYAPLTNINFMSKVKDGLYRFQKINEAYLDQNNGGAWKDYYKGNYNYIACDNVNSGIFSCYLLSALQSERSIPTTSQQQGAGYMYTTSVSINGLVDEATLQEIDAIVRSLKI